MSRSYKEPFVKHGAEGELKKKLQRKSRRSIKNSIRSQEIDEYIEIPDSRTISNSFEYCDKVEKKEDNKYTRK